MSTRLLFIFLLCALSCFGQSKEDLEKYQGYIAKQTRELEALDDSYLKAETYSTRAGFYLLSNDFENALRDANSFLDLLTVVDMDDYARTTAMSSAHALKANIYLRQKDFDLVTYELRQALNIKPKNLGAYKISVEKALFQGKYNAAISDIARWADINNELGRSYDRAQPFQKLTIAYISLQDMANAKEYFTVYRANKEDLDRVFTLDDNELKNIFTFLDAKNYDKALTEVTKLIKQNKRTSESERVEHISQYYAELVLASYIAEQAGNFDLALSYCRKAQTLNPFPQKVNEFIQRLNSKIAVRNSADRTPPLVQVLKSYESDLNSGSTGDRYIQILGKATDQAGIKWVKVNDHLVSKVEQDGFFIADGIVPSGKVQVEVSDLNNNIIRKDISLTPTTSQDPENVPRRYHAVIIACENYRAYGFTHINTVDQAERLRVLLETKYGFRKNNIIPVYNGMYEDIVSQLSKKIESLGPDDNLIIYFSGHGKFMDTEEGRVGFWVPLNAQNQNDYISSNKINILLDSCKARQILIISDACFSASMASEEKNKQIPIDMSLGTRQILTSGNLETVPSRSYFLDAIINALSENTMRLLPAIRLHARIVEPVMDRTGKTPLLLYCGNSGNMGGQFQFKLD